MSQSATLQTWALSAGGFTSDSRAFREGDVFFALKGEKADGATFVPEILKQNPTGVVVERGFAARFPNLRDPRVMEVDGVHAAHREAAGYFRRKFRGRVVAVGGSNGKTTTKEFLATLASSGLKVVKTDKSQNGELGIPRTLEKLREGIDVAVVEVGIDGPNEMLRHASLVAADFALLTSIGEEHLNLLKTVDNVFVEERVLADEALARGGRVFVPSDDPYLARLLPLKGVTGTPLRPEEVDASFHCTLGHPMALRNAALAARVALELGVSREQIAKAIADLVVPDGRGQEIRLAPDFVLLADHYNANVASLRAGIAYARGVADRERLPLKLMLGDMLDLGEATAAAHDEALACAAAANPAAVLLVGPEMSRRAASLQAQLGAGRVTTAPDSASAVPLAQQLRLGPAVLLAKGSRGTRLEVALRAMGAAL